LQSKIATCDAQTMRMGVAWNIILADAVNESETRCFLGFARMGFTRHCYIPLSCGGPPRV
jgi:hypothetical protein